VEPPIATRRHAPMRLADRAIGFFTALSAASSSFERGLGVGERRRRGRPRDRPRPLVETRQQAIQSVPALGELIGQRVALLPQLRHPQPDDTLRRRRCPAALFFAIAADWLALHGKGGPPTVQNLPKILEKTPVRPAKVAIKWPMRQKPSR